VEFRKQGWSGLSDRNGLESTLTKGKGKKKKIKKTKEIGSSDHHAEENKDAGAQDLVPEIWSRDKPKKRSRDAKIQTHTCIRTGEREKKEVTLE